MNLSKTPRAQNRSIETINRLRDEEDEFQAKDEVLQARARLFQTKKRSTTPINNNRTRLGLLDIEN